MNINGVFLFDKRHRIIVMLKCNVEFIYLEHVDRLFATTNSQYDMRSSDLS